MSLPTPYWQRDGLTLYCGDCREVLAGIEPESIDAICTDPPYGIGFMGKGWDRGVPGVEFWEAALRVAKPGAHMLAFGGTRTFHRLTCAIEDAGWEIRDCIMWVYGCLSDDTEVLTPDGWELYHTAKTKEILAYDVQDDVYQWERPERWSAYRVESDTAYRIESDSTDQIVSRNHRCLVERGGMLSFVAAEECAGVERVPTLPDDLHWLPEAQQAVLQPGVQRALSRKEFGEARAQGPRWVDGRKQTELSSENDWPEESSVEGWRNLLQAEGSLCEPINQVRPLSGLVPFDGPEGWVCDGTPVARSRGNRAPAASVGVCASHESRRDGQPDREPDVVCVERGPQEVRTRASYRASLATVTPIEYTGLIFCPTVSTGAFVARRNGKVFITGNSGFPKSLDVSKAIDKAAGAERERYERPAFGGTFSDDNGTTYGSAICDTPATPEAAAWSGWGTAIKPSWEPIILARKPLSGTVAANVLAHGTGALNIDGCRVAHSEECRMMAPSQANIANASEKCKQAGRREEVLELKPNGRWPANLIHDGSDEVVECFPESAGQQGDLNPTGRARPSSGRFGDMAPPAPHPARNDSGSAARFFYCAKPDTAERNCNGADNTHPTVKPLALIRYLLRLIVPPGGVVLDNFVGSGTTLVAAKEEHCRAIGIDIEEEHCAIAKKRCGTQRALFTGGAE